MVNDIQKQKTLNNLKKDNVKILSIDVIKSNTWQIGCGFVFNNRGSKTPLKVVGANNYILEHTTHEFLKTYDLTLLYLPHLNEGVICIIILHKEKKELPGFFFFSGKSMNLVVKNAVEYCSLYNEKRFKVNSEYKNVHKLYEWYETWLEKCSFLPFKDLMHLVFE